MRIALFTETFLPKTDGIVNTLCHLLDHLARRGHASLLFAPAGGPTCYAQTPVVGLSALPFPLYPEIRLVPPTVDVDARLRAFSPDLIHVVNPVSLGVAGLRHARQLGVPVAASYQTDLPGFAARWGLGLFSDLLWGYLRWVHDQADLNFCPSRFTLQELASRGFRNLRVWGRGVDTDRFFLRQASTGWRARLSGGHPNAPLIITVGRLAPEKRIAMLRPVIDTLPQAIFTGYLHGADLAAAYAAADIFVLTGANETFGNVVLEAMASGLPVVVPSTGGQVDHVQHEVNGLIYEAEDSDALVAAVARLAGDLLLGRRLGDAGRAHAERQRWDLNLDGLIRDWQGIVPPARLALVA
jgi:phosphatidylinositol alpha 1,6-mannosyltransferase